MALGFLFRLQRIVVHQGVERGIGRDQRGVGHHATLVFHQSLLSAERHDLPKHLLEDLLAVAVPDRRQRRVIRDIFIQR